MEMAWGILILLGAFVGMECVAWFTHKYVMHGFMWTWHHSHHRPRKGRFERNDLFGLVFAIPSFLLIASGYEHGYDWRFYAGLGMAAYGLAYFLVHDVFVHRRLRWLKKTNVPYFSAMRRTHHLHHEVHTKEGAQAFGFLFVRRKFFKQFRHG